MLPDMNYITNMLIQDEGLKLQAYHDTNNILTIGVGHNLQANPALDILHTKLKLGDSISHSQATQLLQQDINNTLTQLQSHLSNFSSLPNKYQLVLINMCFNLGLTGLLKWQHMLTAMNQNNDQLVIDSIKNSHWILQVPNRANRMIALINNKNPYS